MITRSYIFKLFIPWLEIRLQYESHCSQGLLYGHIHPPLILISFWRTWSLLTKSWIFKRNLILRRQDKNVEMIWIQSCIRLHEKTSPNVKYFMLLDRRSFTNKLHLKFNYISQMLVKWIRASWLPLSRLCVQCNEIEQFLDTTSKKDFFAVFLSLIYKIS